MVGCGASTESGNGGTGDGGGGDGGSSSGGGGGGEGDAEYSNTPWQVATFVLATASLAGGFMGYQKKGSKASLAAGASFATALVASLVLCSAFGALLASVLLGLFFAKRCFKGASLKGPAPVMTLLSFVTSVVSWNPAVLSVASE